MYKVSIALPAYIDLTLPLESTDIYFPGVSKISVFSSLHAKVQSHTIVTFIVTKQSKNSCGGPFNIAVYHVQCTWPEIEHMYVFCLTNMI